MKRSTHVIVQYIKNYKEINSVKEEWKGFEAVIFQHLIDHVKSRGHFDMAQDIQLIIDGKDNKNLTK